MPVKIDVKITGVLEVKKKLDDLSSRQLTRVVREPMAKVGEFWRDQLKSAAPPTPPELSDYPDELKKSIDFRLRGQDSGKAGKARFTLTVGPTMVPPRPRKNKKYRYSKRKKKVVEINQMSPGIYARFLELGTTHAGRHPFMRQVFESTSDQVLEMMRQGILDGVDKARVK